MTFQGWAKETLVILPGSLSFGACTLQEAWYHLRRTLERGSEELRCLSDSP